jgi:hypothetical protein
VLGLVSAKSRILERHVFVAYVDLTFILEHRWLEALETYVIHFSVLCLFQLFTFGLELYTYSKLSRRFLQKMLQYFDVDRNVSNE